jgi:glycerol-3-phosphate dehydrogenase
MVTVLGGKYTTHRKMAEEAVDAALGPIESRHRPSITKDAPLYGGDTLPLLERLNGSLSQEKLDHLIATYGSSVNEVLAIIHANPAEAQQLCPHHPHLLAEVTHAIKNEQARHIDDWFFRRTSIGYSACKGLDSIDIVARKFAEMEHWDDATLASEEKAYRGRC